MPSTCPATLEGRLFFLLAPVHFSGFTCLDQPGHLPLSDPTLGSECGIFSWPSCPSSAFFPVRKGAPSSWEKQPYARPQARWAKFQPPGSGTTSLVYPVVLDGSITGLDGVPGMELGVGSTPPKNRELRLEDGGFPEGKFIHSLNIFL